VVFDRLEELAQLCQARHGLLGAFIEDKNSGTILLQQVLRRGIPAEAPASAGGATSHDAFRPW
jgi:hypothetical protein